MQNRRRSHFGHEHMFASPPIGDKRFMSASRESTPGPGSARTNTLGDMALAIDLANVRALWKSAPAPRRRRPRPWRHVSALLPTRREAFAWLVHPDRFKTSIRSFRSIRSILSFASAGSIASALSAGSILSVTSAGSILSINSAGSILSINSVGSILSINSAGSILSKKGRTTIENRSVEDPGAAAVPLARP